jgi:hypothetical protein
MKSVLVIVISVSVGAAAGVARADAFDRVGEGASLYGEMRPVALAGALKRLGVDQLPAVQRIKQQVGGIDVLDPALLAPTGLDVASPIAASVEFSPQGAVTHVRVVATLRDASVFRAFLGAVAGGGQLPLKPAAPDSPEAHAGILAVAAPSEELSAIARIEGDALIVDAVDVWGGHALAATEIARRFSTGVTKAFAPGRGARRLFASDTAVALYADGRRFSEVFEAIYRQDLEDDLKNTPKPQRAALRQKRTLKFKKCIADWAHSPSTFDDVGLALAADPREVRFTLGWGTQGDPPLGGLRFAPRDYEGVDYEFWARQAPVAGALFAASSSPFAALRRSGIYTSLTSLAEFGKRCGDQVNVGIAVRGWPLAAAAGLAQLDKPETKQASAGFDLSSVMAAFGQLRNVVVMVRDVSGQSAQFAVSTTFDNAAKPMLDLLLAAFGGGGTAKSLAPNRTPTVYSVANPAVGNFVGAVETLPKGQVMFTLADSDESLLAAYRKPTLMPGAAPVPARSVTPIAAIHLDGGLVAKLVTNAGASGDGVRPALDLMSRLKRVDADLAADGDLFRLTVRAPLK